jgi:DNA invertase Pin-like site-specific DNA recombinase
MTTNIYCRVSKKNNNSLESQKDRCVHYCKENNIPVNNIYFHTGTARNGNNMQDLHTIINEMNSGDMIIISNICRLSRCTLEGLKLLDKIEKKGIKIYSVAENLLYDGIYNKYYFTLELASAERESNIISTRLSTSTSAKRKRKASELSKTEKQLITEIKHRRETGETRQSICDDLNSRDILYRGVNWNLNRITMVSKIDV